MKANVIRGLIAMRRMVGLILLTGITLVGWAHATGIGSRVFVVQREAGSLAVYDFMQRRLLPHRITGLGNLRHATMTFTPDLRYGFLATRGGKNEPHRFANHGIGR